MHVFTHLLARWAVADHTVKISRGRRSSPGRAWSPISTRPTTRWPVHIKADESFVTILRTRWHAFSRNRDANR